MLSSGGEEMVEGWQYSVQASWQWQPPSLQHAKLRLQEQEIRYREEHSASVVLSWCTL